MEVHKDGAQEPRSGPVVWMGNRNEVDAVMADGMPELDALRSPAPEDEPNRQEMYTGKNRRELGKKGSSCGGKGKGGKGGKGGKKGGSCDPWECENGKLNNNGWDYDGTMAKTADGRTCQKWTDVVDKSGWKWANYYYGFGAEEKK